MRSTCGWSAGPSTAFWGRTARANPPPSRCSPACWRRPAARCGCSARTSATRTRALAVKRRVGVVPENLALFDNLTAREYLTFVGRMYLLPARDGARAERGIARDDGLWRTRKRSSRWNISHGMKKKLALAAALMPNPELLFLDEPFEGVDAVASRVLARHAARSRRARRDGVSDVARAGDRREALHARGHHRAGQAGAPGPDGGIARDGSLEERFLAVVGDDQSSGRS